MFVNLNLNILKDIIDFFKHLPTIICNPLHLPIKFTD